VEGIAAWGAVRQSIKVTLDAMRCGVLNAFSSVLSSLRHTSSISSSGAGSTIDRGPMFVHQSELFSSELLEAVKDGITVRTFNVRRHVVAAHRT